MARDNPKWGCVRIRGELLKLGHVISATAIRKLLRRNRIGPAPLRSRLSWKAFLRAQASAIVLTDFLSVDTVLLKRLSVLLYMELATRRVIWFAVTDRPEAFWVSQQARNLCWELAEIGVDARFLVHDHDAKYGGASDLVFRAEGIEVIRTPIAAPKANAHIERQIGSTRRECLDWILILNRRHLERVLAEWLEHYNSARPHRALGLRTPIARSDPVLTAGPLGAPSDWEACFASTRGSRRRQWPEPQLICPYDGRRGPAVHGQDAHASGCASTRPGDDRAQRRGLVRKPALARRSKMPATCSRRHPVFGLRSEHPRPI